MSNVVIQTVITLMAIDVSFGLMYGTEADGVVLHGKFPNLGRSYCCVEATGDSPRWAGPTRLGWICEGENTVVSCYAITSQVIDKN